MPRNSNGVYSLPPGNPVSPGTLIEADWANNTMTDLAAALTGSLPRDGTAPMLAPLILSSATPTQGLEATPKSYVDSVAIRGSGMALGFMAPFAAASAPPGWLLCNGQAVSRLTYADLFAVIGTAYGSGDGVTTFNVPDLRDLFVRGKGASRAIGSLQADALKSHTHAVSDPGHKHTITDPGHSHVLTDPGHNHAITDPGHRHTQSAIVSGGPSAGLTAGSNLVQGTVNTGSALTGISVQSKTTGITEAAAYTGLTEATQQTGIQNAYTGDAETRPANIAFDFYIKALADGSGGGGGGVTAITSSNTNAIGIDNTEPSIPQLVVKTNVPLGLVALDVNNLIPDNLISLDASQVAVTPVGGITAVEVQAALEQLDNEKAPKDNPTLNGTTTVSVLDVNGQFSIGTDPGISGQVLVTQGAGLPPIWGSPSSGTLAVDVGFTPSGSITATNVQDAIEELDAETMPNVVPGGSGNVLTSNGAAWLSVAPTLRSQKFINSGSFTVPAGVTALLISACAGGGGGGGGGGAAGSNGCGGGGGGGGAGQSIVAESYTVIPGQVIPITVGAGGAGGVVNVSGGTGNAGSNGGDTVIGTLVTLAKGFGGLGGLNSVNQAGGALGGTGYPNGGTGTDTQANIAGGMGGTGASGPFGGGGSGGKNGPGGHAGLSAMANSGCGGGGGGGSWTGGSGNGGAGGNGGSGKVIISW